MWRLRVALARLAMLTRGLDTIIAWDLGSIRSDLKKINELFVPLFSALSPCGGLNLPIELSGDWINPAP
ncbi:MAG: hypothetical protein MK034_03740 [Dehalococcoidia bacterium]|jgi:hypothetical protein|nr:hypothetical protein [Dehalococcoidia bacterium]